MSVVRRLYLYGVAFASLVMLAVGLSGLGAVTVDALASALPGQGADILRPRSQVTENAALVLVGLPVWLLHWGLAQRGTRREPEERGAAVRRLYLYAVLLVFALRLAFALYDVLLALGGTLLGIPSGLAGRPGLPGVLEPLPSAVVSAALWAYHRGVVVADRRAAGEQGASATLRRWYTYGLAFGGLLTLLNGAEGAFRIAWESLASLALGGAVQGDTEASVRYTARTLIGLPLWLAHWSGRALASDGDVRAEDARSLLRPVYLFLTLGVSIGFALTATARLLYYALARLLGVEEPGGETGPLPVLLGGPLATIAVYGVSWRYHRRALALQARAQPELPEQAGVRRLYVYLVSLIALALLAVGAGGLLWTLADAATNAERTLNRPDWWREQVSLYATLLIVGLPVWLAHWGPVQGPAAPRWTAAEPGSLARRLYLYLTLLLGVLTLLGSGAVAARQVLDLVLGEAATGGVVTNLARALAVAAVSGLVVFYHQRVLRRDLQVAVSAPAPAPATAPGAPDGIAGPSAARPYGVLTRRGGVEASAWFQSADEARRERMRIASADGLEWATLVRIEEAPPEQAVPQG